MNLNINNKIYSVSAASDETLLNILREELHLMGTKKGCDIGVCGTCTVLINGEAKRSCVVKLSQLKEADAILTIEGVAQNEKLHPIQEAFIEAGAIQCGFCTPGMVLTAKALLDKNPKPAREEIKKAFVANLCRCTGYQQIFEAVELASKKMS
ncbi:MAG: (2Fe-2S)-binding protein [Deltaproteobacteria bacterium]|nr:(2Fe-2S)-binding protein [Deltaproteobacteria bacterium]